jgi:chromosome segregation ATPase
MDSHISQLESTASDMESKLEDDTYKFDEATSQLSITSTNLMKTELANKEVNQRFLESQNEITELLSSMEVEREKSRLAAGELRKANQSLTESNSSLQLKHAAEMNDMNESAKTLKTENESLQKNLLDLRE